MRLVSNGLAHGAYATHVVTAAQRCCWTFCLIPARGLRQCRPQLEMQLEEGVFGRECGARVLRERRGHCPGVARPEGDNNIDHRRRVKLVNRVPTAWGNLCWGCPLLGDASDASSRRWTSFFGRLLRAQVLEFHDHGEDHFRHRFIGGARTLRRRPDDCRSG